MLFPFHVIPQMSHHQHYLSPFFSIHNAFLLFKYPNLKIYSAASVVVLPEAEALEVELRPQDLKIDVFRAGGAGGQHRIEGKTPNVQPPQNKRRSRH